MPVPTQISRSSHWPIADTRRGNWQTTKLYHVTQGIVADAASAVADWGERNFGDPQTLIDLVTWAKTNYPADRYALYFWGHGWNWHPGWVMEDDTDVDTLDYHEMKAAIPQVGFIDVVGYDGCNMATLEIYKLWQNKATAVAASEEYVGWNGIEYDTVIAQLRANPFMSADQVAVASAQSAIVLGGERTWSAVAVDGRLASLLSSIVLFEGHTNAYSDVHGMTISHISKAAQKDSNYTYYRSTIDLALTTSWDEFLNA